ncbi:DivIVA domain-containing protein [Clostridium sp. HMP27]|uniref:DivIVA domain-containing protein n=1 Tax=Clostridium sp. HMP27 TaxID=1487921 RepID=UPI00052BA4B4|nr:DivIVA domain-containing protein [Clostridium sp. HMP27]KGK86150.1 cell division protein DivIVA [Clostridium sp. HMP27]
MKTTSMDITSREFKKSFRGYDMDEVEEFLEKIAEDYETLYKENSYLKEKINALQENIEHYAKMEDTIQSTLLLAQNASDQAKRTAQKEAELVVLNANETAQRILDKAHNEVMKINDDFERTKQEFIIFKTKFKTFMQSQLEVFETMEKDYIRSYNIGNYVDKSKNDSLNLEELGNNISIELSNDESFMKKDLEETKVLDTEELNQIKSFFAER